MMYIDNAAGAWMTPSGVVPGVLLFQLVSTGAGWLIVSGLLAAVCAMLWIVSSPHTLFSAPGKRRWGVRPPRRKLHLAPDRRTQPQHM